MYIIGGKFKKQRLVVPKGHLVRPTTAQLREALFNICQQDIEGARFLDLFAGSGAMGLEALSRGALTATFVENNKLALGAIYKNIEHLLCRQQTRVFPLDIFKALKLLYDKKETFDIVYIDPPYGKNLSAPVLEFLDHYPLVEKGGSLFIEDSHLEEPTLKNLQIQGTRRIGRTILVNIQVNPFATQMCRPE